MSKKELTPKQAADLLKALKSRFDKNLNRHIGLTWPPIEKKLVGLLENSGRSVKWNAPAANRM